MHAPTLPIDDDRATRLLPAARAGDTRALAELCLIYQPVVDVMALNANRRIHSLVLELDDFRQDGAEAFIHAVRDFDTARAPTFTAYAWSAIRQHLANRARAASRRDAPDHCPDPLTVEWYVAGPASPPTPFYEALYAAIADLTPPQQHAIHEAYWTEATAIHLAENLHTTHQATTALLRRARKTLRDHLDTIPQGMPHPNRPQSAKRRAENEEAAMPPLRRPPDRRVGPRRTCPH